MKDLKKILMTLLLGVCFLTLTACSGFSFNISGCSLSRCDFLDFESCTPEEEPEEESDVISTSNYSFEIRQRADYLYECILTGTLYLERYPDEITFDLRGKNQQTFVIEIDTVKYNAETGIYAVTFEQVLDYNYLYKEETTALMCYRYANVVTELEELEVVIDDDYFYIDMVSNDSGEFMSGLDKESNWSDFI